MCAMAAWSTRSILSQNLRQKAVNDFVGGCIKFVHTSTPLKNDFRSQSINKLYVLITKIDMKYVDTHNLLVWHKTA